MLTFFFQRDPSFLCVIGDMQQESNDDTFLPNDIEKNRVFQYLSEIPTDEDDTHHCVLYSKKITKASLAMGSALQRICFRKRQYHPKFLLFRWYFGEKETPKNVSTLSCAYNQDCVNPFHIRTHNSQTFDNTKNKFMMHESPLLNLEKKRKYQNYELENQECIIEAEKKMFAKESMDSETPKRKKMKWLGKLFDE